jgi:alkylated DNA repair dioxygenase AlkB
MSSLFPTDPVVPEGFVYFPDFLSMNEEKELLRSISGFELRNMIFQGYEAKRKTANFGLDWSFDHRKLSKGKDIPADFNFIIEKVAKQLSLKAEDFAELLLTEYPPGSVINWHRDAPPFGLIAGISLVSDCIFRLRPYDKSKQGRRSIISFPVKRRSLYVMQGPARSEWEHSISPMKGGRYSITLRTLKDPALPIDQQKK